MEYLIKKIDRKEFEFDLANCDTCKIFLNGFLIGRYDFLKAEYSPAIDDWFTNDYFERLTKRQQKLVLKYANIYFLKLYKKIDIDLIKQGAFFSPAPEVIEKEEYYTSRIRKINENIKNLGV